MLSYSQLIIIMLDLNFKACIFFGTYCTVCIKKRQHLIFMNIHFVFKYNRF